MTFSVEIAESSSLSEGGHRVEIYIDKRNLSSLIKRLELLAQDRNKRGDHLHLMSESWGLGDLTEEIHIDGNLLTHHLKIIIED